MLYNYKCRMCGQTFRDEKSVESRFTSAMCPHCFTEGAENIKDPDTGEMTSKLEILPPKRVHVMKRAVEAESERDHGNQGVPQPGLGRNIRTRTSKEFREEAKKARERLYERTSRPHSTVRPYPKDPADPRAGVVFEKVTNQGVGLDLGEIAPVAELGPPAETALDKEFREAQDRLGEPLEMHPEE